MNGAEHSIAPASGGLPAAPGVRFRRLLPGDGARLYPVRAACALHDALDTASVVERPITEAELGGQVTEALAADTAQDWLIVEAGAATAGYSRVLSWVEDDGVRVFLSLCWLVPEWRGRGLGTAMLSQTEADIRRMAEAHPSTGAWEYAANADSRRPEAMRLLDNAGYHIAYTVEEMELTGYGSVPRPCVPAGLEVRPLVPEHHRDVWRAIWDSYPRGRYAAVETEEEFAEYFGAQLEPGLCAVAWHGSRVAGQVLCRVREGRGEVYEMSVSPEWRRQGLARSLLSLGLRALERRGIGVVRLHTVAEFPTQARVLYSSVGFRTVQEFYRYRKQGSAGADA